MLRFGRKCERREADEFEIVCSYNHHEELIQSEAVSDSSASLKRPPQEPVLKPAWFDDECKTTDESHHPIPILDVHSKAKRVAQDSSYSDENDSDEEYAFQCKTKVLREDKDIFLPETKTVTIKRLFDANRERISMGSLTSVHFNSAFQMLLTASADSTLAVFKVDGKENALLRDRVFEKFPLSSAQFTLQGDRIVLTGNRNSFRLYDLRTGIETRASPFIGSTSEEVLVDCQLSNGQPNIVGLKNGANKVYLADLRTLERIAALQARSTVRSYCFVKDGIFLDTIDTSGIVYAFDLRMRKPLMVHQWTDEASTGGAVIASSPDGQWIACGSDSGFVNVYHSAKVIQSPNPQPDKCISNLRSRADLAVFHPGLEMLCIGSSDQSAAVRLYHLRSRHVFDNFPVSVGRLHMASSVAFSPGGKYLCIGQKNGRAALYSISHYPDY